MQQQPAALSELIRWLRHFGARPACYIEPVDVPNAQSFLGGVSFCAQVFTRPSSHEEYDAAVASRGWQVSRDGPEAQMRQRGMSEREIIAELAEIEAAILERRSETAGPVESSDRAE